MTKGDKQKKVGECSHGDTIWGDICLDCGHRQTKPPTSPKDYLTDREKIDGEIIWKTCRDLEGNKDELIKYILALISQERERLLREVEECLGGDVTPVANDFSKEGEAYTRGYNDRLSDIRKAIKQCIK